jgi:type I restriction enzyme S subunit
MTNTATYKTFKTNIAWMPELPEHWKLSRVKNYFTFSNEVVGEDYSGFNVLSLSVNGVIIRDMESGKGKHSMSMDLYQIVHPKSIILCLFDMDVTPRIVGICENLGIITSAYTTIVPKRNVCERFYYYFFLHQDYNKSLKAQGTGVRTTLTNTQFGAVKIPVPPYQEQLQIAHYLDEKSQKINHFIAKKQQFIALLKEQRQSVINTMVSGKLLVVNGQLISPIKVKDSGIKWLGNIPEHWEVRRLANIGTFSKGGNISRAELIEDENGIPAILYGDIYTKYDIVASKIINRISEETASNSVVIKKGELLFTGSGETKEDIGKCIVYNGDETVYAGGDVIIFKQEMFDSVFISYSQNTSYAQMQKLITAKGDIIVHTYSSKLKNVIMPYPPKEEQTQIVNYIKTETATIDSAIAKAEREIELIKEYKEAMIAEAVMGKIVVSG